MYHPFIYFLSLSELTRGGFFFSQFLFFFVVVGVCARVISILQFARLALLHPC